MSYQDELNVWPAQRVREMIDTATPADVERALAREERTPQDLAALLSEHADRYLEDIAREANRLTRWHFGRTISLYAPIYISNVCGADCVYCGYAARSGNKERRLTLTEEELRGECEALAAEGYQSVLLLTGEAPLVVTPSDIADAVAVSREYFPSVAVEIYSLDEKDYALLVERGLDGVTLYMETYDRETYARLHLRGAKRNYEYRLDASERAGRAGVRRLGIGALLGLYDWQVDGFWTAMHGRYLQKACWQSAVAISFPRLRHTPERFSIPHLVTDKEFVRLLLASRLFLPEAGFNLSTREPAVLRDNLIPLGLTHMSAGSSTRPGGYASHDETLEQFALEDTRKPPEVVAAIRRAGYDPVWKDFDFAFDR